MRTDDVIVLNVSKEFSKTPGPRFKKEGKFSGEEFREEVLEKFFAKAISMQKKLLINLDGGAGYGTSFLEESFGGLVRKHGDSKKIKDTIIFISSEEPYLIDDILDYIENAI